MQEATPQAQFEQARRTLVALCADGQFAQAQLFLIREDLSPEGYPGLWEYLARRSAAAERDAIAHAVRRALWAAGIWSGDTALREAAHYLGEGDHDSAAYSIEAVFGPAPEDREARLMLARCHVQRLAEQGARGAEGDGLAREDARDLVADIGFDTPDEAMTVVDLLRFSEHYEAALHQNGIARVRFPEDIRFDLREARILEQMGDIEQAILIWEAAIGRSERYRAEGLFKLLSLYERIDRAAAAERVTVELLSGELSLPDRLSLAVATGHRGLMRALAEFIAAGGEAGAPVSFQDGVACAEMLLDQGEVGLAVWLRRRRVSVGPRVTGVLDDLGFSVDGPRQMPGSFAEAAALRSPDILLPLQDFLEQPAKPDGWPGRRSKPGRVLLVNNSLTAGGAERQFVELVRSLIEAGLPRETIDVALYSVSPDRGHAQFLPDLERLGVAVHDLSRSRVGNPTLPAGAARLAAALPAGLRADMIPLWHLANEIRPDVIHGWQDRAALAAGLVAQLLQTERAILSTRNMAPPARTDRSLVPHRALYRAFADTPNMTMTSNSSAGSADYERWLDLAPGSVGVLGNTVDLARFHPGLRRRPEDGGPIRIGGIFRLAANKRPLLWLETVAALRERLDRPVVPCLFGRGPLREAVLDRATELGLDDLELVDRAGDPAELYGGIDALLLMSRVEGTPNVVLEAQACGLPVCACDVGGVVDALYVDPASGGLMLPAAVSPDDAAARLADWLPGAVAAEAGPRIAFVTDRFGPARFAATCIALYTGQPIEVPR